MLNVSRTCSIYGQNAQFMVCMLNLWSACSIYGEHAKFMVVAFIVTCSQFRVNGQMFVEIMSKVQGLHNING